MVNLSVSLSVYLSLSQINTITTFLPLVLLSKPSNIFLPALPTYIFLNITFSAI